jgi:serine protease
VVAPAMAAGAAGPHEVRPRGPVHSSGTQSNLVWGGGPLETTPVVYIDYWGSPWAAGFTKNGYTSAQAQAYNNDFFGNVGGSSWANIDTQYCEGLSPCITNPSGQLKNSVVHNVTLPKRITQSAIAAEAIWLMGQTGGYNPNATYFVYTPSGHSMSGFGTSWCAWHSSTTDSSGHVLAYAYMPYQPDAGFSCGVNFVNSTNDSYGNGYFDGFSVVGGHEYAESVTDPHPSSGWVDTSGSEIGDKCAWSSLSTDITLGSHFYAVQPLWSNASAGCVTAY